MTELEKNVIKYQKKGWILLNSSDKAAQLKKPKQGFSCLPNILFSALAFIGLVFFGVNHWTPGMILFIVGIAAPLIYLIAFILQRERLIVLYADDSGKIKAGSKVV